MRTHDSFRLPSLSAFVRPRDIDSLEHRPWPAQGEYMALITLHVEEGGKREDAHGDALSYSTKRHLGV
jgi:hypothetical protein